MLKKVAEKEELRVALKHFEKLIKNLHSYIKNKFTLAEETDDAMLTKKPLLSAKCASCERGLKNISGIISQNGQDFLNWNKMPTREPIAKYGKGFSKILASIKVGDTIDEGSDKFFLNENSITQALQTQNAQFSSVGLSLDEEFGNVTKIETSRTYMNSTAPNFNINNNGSYTERNTMPS